MNDRGLLQIALIAAYQAGEAILTVYDAGKPEVQYKTDQSPLTLADLLADEIIHNLLSETNIPVLSEESAQIPFSQRKHWTRCWIVDPLDGTKEFIRRNGEFTVNIALVEHGRPVLGVIYTPVTREIYFGIESTGSCKQTIPKHANPIDPEELICTSTRLPVPDELPHPTMVVASRSHRNRETDDYIHQLENEMGDIQVLSRGSSLKICLVAEGTADIYPRFAPTKEWDTAAGHAIAKFAGCTLADPKTSEELHYNKENLTNSWFIVKRRHDKSRKYTSRI